MAKAPGDLSRREFLNFMGRSLIATGAATYLPGCTTSPKASTPFAPLPPAIADQVSLADGLTYKVLIGFDETINSRGEKFGYDNDFIALIKDSPKSGTLFVNHESANPFLLSGIARTKPRSKEQIGREMKAVGCSILAIENSYEGWKIQKASARNRRLDAMTPINFAWKEAIAGAHKSIGTISNCSGGITPWNTFLTCEENYQNHYGEVFFENGKRIVRQSDKSYGWIQHYEYPPEHYGWVVEVNPRNGNAQKLIALGRFGHEGAAVVLTKDGFPVVYSGDDVANGCIYKFVSDKKGSLETGTLYVANLEKGRWIPLSLEKNPSLSKHFKDQTELLIRTREAALRAGGTPLDRPEDIEKDPVSGAMICALTNNKEAGNYFGSILRIEERDGDHKNLEFQARTWMVGGPDTGFACPDNFAFDRKGNLWMTNDIADPDIGKGVYSSFGNNSLFYIPMSGPNAGEPFRVASAPIEAEFTGPCFADDGTLLISVQHPGNLSNENNNATSHWPGGGKSTPHPAVISIHGDLLNRLLT